MRSSRNSRPAAVRDVRRTFVERENIDYLSWQLGAAIFLGDRPRTDDRYNLPPYYTQHGKSSGDTKGIKGLQHRLAEA